MKKILMMVFAEPGFREEFPAQSLPSNLLTPSKLLASFPTEKSAV